MKTNTLKYTVVKSFREKGITYKVTEEEYNNMLKYRLFSIAGRN